MANAEIIAVGSELLTPQRIDTNSLFITEKLNELGIELLGKQVIGDDRARLTAAIQGALDRSQIILLCGGLGPTEDDITRDAAAAALGRELVHSPEQEVILRKRFAQFNRPVALNNLRQTYLITDGEALANPNGTAPGQFVRTVNGALILLPGPPRELKAMLEEQVLPRLRDIVPKQVIRVRSFRIAGMGESDLDTLIAPVYTKYENPATTVLSAPGDLFVHLRARCDTEAEAEALLREVGDPIAALIGDRAYTSNAQETLETTVGNLLRQRGQTVSVAESFTGGLLAGRFTEQSGSSDFFVGGFVTYTDEQKRKLLGVPADLLQEHTAVSEQVAKAMADGARERSGSTYAISTTGYAGPAGGTAEQPVGTTYIAVSGPEGTTAIRRFYGGGDRYRVRALGTQNALDYFRRTLLAGQ